MMILAPLQALLKSRKFMVALVTMLFNVITVLIPVFTPDIKTLLVLPALVLGFGVINGIAKEDAAKLAGDIINPAKTLQEQIKDLLTIAVDEIAQSGGTIHETSTITVNPDNTPDTSGNSTVSSVSATPAADPAIIGESADKRRF